MNPTEALTEKTTPDSTPAPAAVDWLRHPDALVERVSLALRLGKEPECESPAPGEDEA